ncbi:chemokine (C-X-C motif) ligand 12a (stromal cell-derived factor 1) [Neoarius graeffei]|uniref:chemokine (C-X-C motif) ligand 12a (stromal cell-derived factor 1) n=1 Tax=Neoarius graeffei TaxID=443677 RepID=UPI00298CBB6E|nr:chemokine (C-X-C motif) ligand 12a (stromal cell-derived factor 1) [Neoarius graeffei]
MDVRMILLAVLVIVNTYGSESEAKPISLVERCWCRSSLVMVPQRSIRELKFIHTPNCPFQVIAKLRSNQVVCLNPETKWIKQYLEKALERMKTKQESHN